MGDQLHYNVVIWVPILYTTMNQNKYQMVWSGCAVARKVVTIIIHYIYIPHSQAESYSNGVHNMRGIIIPRADWQGNSQPLKRRT